MVRITIQSSSRNKQLNPMTIWFILRADHEFGEMAEWLTILSGTILNGQGPPQQGEAQDGPNKAHAVSATESKGSADLESAFDA